MGLGWFTFHGAEHSRFGHSIGALFLAKKMMTHLSNHCPEINTFNTEVLTCALIHDIGHGPFSHTSEKLSPCLHECWTKRIIEEGSEINYLLKEYDKNFPQVVINTLEYKATHHYLSQIISGYIDCDRLDYLYRDSYYVGVPYGLTGSDRIISSLEIDKDSQRIVVRETTGLDAVIHYLQARHSMYQQVYQHKKNLACDFLLKKITQRIKETKPKAFPEVLFKWIDLQDKTSKNLSIDDYLRIDDCYLLGSIQSLASDIYIEQDKVLKDLSGRLISRRLFKSLEIRQEINKDRIAELVENLKPISKSKGLSPDYYIGLEQSASKPYEPYRLSSSNLDKAIYIKQHNGRIQELSEISGLVRALSQENIIKICLVFAPELEDDINQIKEFRELFK